LNNKYILSIDQGTSGTTLLLVTTKGKIVYKYYQAFPQSYPKPGWVEHDPETIWQTVRDGIKNILSLSWLQEDEIKAIGITNQRETVVVWDRQTGSPVYPAIVWQCRRTANFCAKLSSEGLEPQVTKKTGLRLDPYFSATKIRWILDHVTGVPERAREGKIACGTIDSWLIWKLTGGLSHVTDYSNASRTLLLNIHTKQWDLELLNNFDIPSSMLPEIKPSVGFFGETDTTLFKHPIPITGVLGDQQAALFGQGCLEPGTTKNTYGTGCFMLMNTGEKCFLPEYGLLTSIGWVIKDKITYILEGSVFTGGAVVKWLRDKLEIIKDVAETETLAKKVTTTDGVYFVPAFTGLGTPHWDPYARGIIIGLTSRTTKEHIVRAALEGIAFQVKEVVDSMSKITKCKPKCLRVDGGAAANNFLLQFQSDICGIPIQRNSSLELTGLGAAFVAGLGIGIWTNINEIKDLVQMEHLFEPKISVANRNKLCFDWLRAVRRSQSWVEQE
jgi:glycerol kinase